MITILDCYTDEPSGLGVPPYLGVYPRYIFGKYHHKNPVYLTIDDLRLHKKYDGIIPKVTRSQRTDTSVYNLTVNYHDAISILKKTDTLIVISGVHVPGKYLSANPATLKEVISLIKDYRCKKILTGPAASIFGTQFTGGKFAEDEDLSVFDEIIEDLVHDYHDIAVCSIKGTAIKKQIPWDCIAEIETARGCSKKIPCSFCTEPLKNSLEFRKVDDILDEVEALNREGIIHFRLGKQSDFFSWSEQDMHSILSGIRNRCNIKTLHIDNVDPSKVTPEKVKLVVKYCTAGNVAALGVETFDENVSKLNFLNSTPEMAFRAIKIINEFGSKIGKNGMQAFIPGINLIFGLIGENKETHQKNMVYLKKIIDSGLLLRRINIRQVALYPNTYIFEKYKNKFLKKNKKFYWKWRNQIRQEIDFAMLKNLVPKDNIIKDAYAEIYDGNTTFLRQKGTYPLIIGIKERLPLKEAYDIRVKDHMLRSIVGELVN